MAFQQPLGLSLTPREINEVIESYETARSNLMKMGNYEFLYVRIRNSKFTPYMVAKYLALAGRYLVEIREYVIDSDFSYRNPRIYGFAVHSPARTLTWCYPTFVTVTGGGIKVDWPGQPDPLEDFPSAEKAAIASLSVAEVHDMFWKPGIEEASEPDAYGPIVG